MYQISDGIIFNPICKMDHGSRIIFNHFPYHLSTLYAFSIHAIIFPHYPLAEVVKDLTFIRRRT